MANTTDSRTARDVMARLRSIDSCMLMTKTGEDAIIAARPMLNLGKTEDLDPTTYHFTTEDSLGDDLQRSNDCSATYTQGDFHAAAQATARMIYDRPTMEKYWTPSLTKWFEDGLESTDLVLVEITPIRVTWWERSERGEIKI